VHSGTDGKRAGEGGELMSRGPQSFKQTALTKALKGAVAAGLSVKRFEIEPEGRIIIIAGKPGEDDVNVDANEWDSVK
jgi:hypothetical protein